MILRILPIGLLFVIAAGLARASETPPLLSTQQVARVVSLNAIQVSPSQIHFLSAVTSRHVDPALDLVSIGPWNQHTMKARLVCHDRSECLPFYVAVQVDTPSVREGWPKVLALQPQAKRPPPDCAGWSGSDAAAQRRQAPDHDTVICLENGEIGRNIRVTTRDRKQIYKAEVVSAILLKGGI